jgi:serine/threonine protein kinase
MSASNFNLGEARVKEITFGIAKGLQFLHDRGIIHRDLKLENIMMTDKSKLAIPKIIDFGLAKILSKSETSSEPFGTIGYAAPEILKSEPYSFPCDLWSLGCLLYAMIT